MTTPTANDKKAKIDAGLSVKNDERVLLKHNEELQLGRSQISAIV